MKKCYKLLPIFLSAIVFLIVPIENVVAQSQTVKGSVADATDGEPLAGVNVVVKGTTNGAATDADGNFSLSVSSLQGKLVFSFVGYQKKEVAINGRNSINVKLKSQAAELGELVVTGYGEQRAQSITTSVAHVGAEDLNTASVTSFSEALAGQAPGVRVTQASGSPGSGISIQVRGVGSINADNDPLYVLDGVPLASTESRGGSSSSNPINPLASLNSNDIASINILKGASATSIYGSRGANGVVLITTKSGKAGESQINFGVNMGWQGVANKIPIMNKEQFIQSKRDAADIAWARSKQGRNLDDPYSARTDDYIPLQEYQEGNSSALVYHDWQDALYRDAAPQRKYNLSASGGTEDIQYYLSGNYQDTDGILVNSNFKNYGFRAKVRGDISDHVEAGISIAPSYSTRNLDNAPGLSYYGGSAAIVLSQNPFYPFYNDDGSYSFRTNFTNPDGSPAQQTYSNPIAANNSIDNSLDHYSTLGNVFVKLNFTDHLSLKSNISGDFNFYNQNKYSPSGVGYGTPGPFAKASGNSSSNRDIQWDNRNLLTYNNQFAGKHNLDVMLGLEQQKNTYLNSGLNGSGFPNDRVHTLNNAGSIDGGYTSRAAWTMLSYFGRVKYDFNRKYLVQASLRRDGSSRFGSDNKWGLFPSASIGWRIGREDFMQNISAISSLKVRAGYGVTGNNGIGNYASIGRVSQTSLALSESGDLINGLYQNSLSNPTLTWEKQKALNVGLDLGLYDGRVNFQADFYNRINDDLLLDVNLPLATGYSGTTRNLGKVRNRGIELSLNTVNVQAKDFSWSTRFNFALNRNEVRDLDGQVLQHSDPNYYNPSIFITRKGDPIGSYYGYVFEGVYTDKEDFLNHAHFVDVNKGITTDGTKDPDKIDESKVYTKHLGSAKFKDLNGDGLITPEGDKKVIGDNYPDFTYGISSTFNYKNLSFSFQLQGEQGTEALNVLKSSLYRRQGGYFTEYWRSPSNPGDGQTFAPAGGGLGHETDPSSYFVEDASFLRINNIQLGYQLPQSLLSASGVLREVRVYVNARNLKTWTDYQGYNPQVRSGVTYGGSYGTAATTPGLDYGSYPLPRIFSLGINVGL